MNTARRLRAYLAAPLFNPRERHFNEQLEKHLAPYVDVFLPQRDGELLTRLIAQGQSLAVAQNTVFSNDIAAIEASDIVVAVLDGRTVDEGVAFEIGYARALGIFCIGFKSDDRSMLPTGDNPMIERGCHRHCSTVDDLIGAIRSLIESILKRNVERGVSATKQPDGDKVPPIGQR